MRTEPHVYRYDMPQDMRSIDSAILETESIVHWPLVQIPYHEIQRLFKEAKKPYPEGTPNYCSLTLGMPTKELVLYPIPDKSYKLTITYEPKVKQL